MSKSLLWKNDEKPVSVIEDTLFDDLRMRKFLEYVFNNYYDAEDFIEIIKNIPSQETLVYRQEIFTDFLNDENEEYDKVYYKLLELISRYTSYKNANEKIKKKVFFLFYYHHYYEFLDKLLPVIENAKSVGLQTLSNDIKKLLNDSNVVKERKEIKSIYNTICDKLEFKATYHEGSPYISLEYGKCVNLEDELKEIALLLNISLEKVPRLQNKREINPYFVYEVFQTNPELLSKINDFYSLYSESNISDTNNIQTQFTYIEKPLFDLDIRAKEIKYYLSMKTIFKTMASKGVPYCKVTLSDNETIIKNLYDISLTMNNINIIPNDFSINDQENIHFVLGVNSGGKTCYLRSIGENYVLFMNSGYMFASMATAHPIKYIHTHFPNEENYRLGEGRLRDEISRLDKIKETFSSDCLALLNETFSSTSEEKACILTNKLLDDIADTKAKVIYVTHQYKIFEEVHDNRLVFFTPAVDEKNGNERTHKIKKVDKKLLSYVGDILYKHGLTKEQLLSNREQLLSNKEELASDKEQLLSRKDSK